MGEFSDQIFQPARELSPFIRHYRLVQFPAAGKEFWVPADSRNLMLNLLEGAATIRIGGQEYRQPQHSLRGTCNQALFISFPCDYVSVVGTEYTKVGLRHFASDSMEHLVNGFYALADADPATARLKERLAPGVGLGAGQLVEALNEYHVARLIKLSGTRIRVAHRVYTALEGSSHEVTVKELTHTLGVHTKTLARVVKEFSGLTTKRYLDLRRFEAQVGSLLQDFQLGEFGSSHGYYDQSHLIKVFRRFGGVTPGQLAQLDASWVHFLQGKRSD